MSTAEWYAKLIKPSWAPAPSIFGPVWTFLYVLIIISFTKVFIMWWQKKISWLVALPFILNIFFNIIFTPIQLGLKNNLLSSVNIIFILITLIWAIIAIYPYSRWVAFIQAPYLIWVLIATALQVSITYLNR